jgi:2-polyprenyl-3-methyl-5-hydroxy-6-metoxy-1,4-benzoquinol methylase
VTGVDLTRLAIERARLRAEDAGVAVRFLTADLTDPPNLGGPYYFLFDRGCYHAVREVDVERLLLTYVAHFAQNSSDFRHHFLRILRFSGSGNARGAL